MSSSRSSTVCFLVILVWFNFKLLIFWPGLCKKAFDVSASRSSPTCFLVLLMWSFAKFELRKIFWIIIFLMFGKKFTCLLAGHPLLLFGSFSVVQFEIFNILTYVFVRKLWCVCYQGISHLLFSSFGVVVCKIGTKRNLFCYIFPRFREKFHVSASRSSPIYFLVLLVWSNEKSFNILVYVFVRKILTCLLTGHPPFVFYIFWCGSLENWKEEKSFILL